MTNSQGTLYVVPTPIGNLADMVPRAIQTLQSVSLIACEDTRHSSRLLDHFNIQTRTTAYHDHSDDRKTASLLAMLEQGEDLALISDAGTPLISDPGYRLIREARAQGVRVVPIPGACAVIAALSAAGLPSDRFIFEGFLPAKAQARRQRLERLTTEPRTIIFYEAPHRVLESVTAMRDVFGAEREVVLAREISKAFETIAGMSLEKMCDWIAGDSNQQRGEIVVLVRGAPEREAVIDEGVAHTMRVLLEELPVKKAAALASRLTGLRKNELYQWALDNVKA
ncbi:16S rRNA (cytidine(1402)-2'-O)-methyltransferase [Gilvimarinus sp. SDUM040013]|uniref:Ribosomal RNA small subunit methyltransferase I n=1 Tax=Gilvimarinus gilvus TaxID=3058038 RepID=A0ABU4RST6_9GAMM|nr:16S rRNA (cytidine(1402)-2'-O)-methyltransferase [Gilvimarinus sp. SDUM040013]MDO3388401.1 16S rRNA (cytidine(1402)-2'-O)-methyltransferase [Gilvimarinus sp. SDUM040013]MDX6847951.1 16S rRNA (cytidine(1402)-2'-O)-methyltransferase [Gilvimarinus sp. SDUM040013]